MTTASYTLARLRREYPGWHIWRSQEKGRAAAWYASNLNPCSDRDPTLAADSAEKLERQLANPPERIGKSFSAVGVTS